MIHIVRLIAPYMWLSWHFPVVDRWYFNLEWRKTDHNYNVEKIPKPFACHEKISFISSGFSNLTQLFIESIIGKILIEFSMDLVYKKVVKWSKLWECDYNCVFWNFIGVGFGKRNSGLCVESFEFIGERVFWITISWRQRPSSLAWYE